MFILGMISVFLGISLLAPDDVKGILVCWFLNNYASSYYIRMQWLCRLVSMMGSGFVPFRE